MEESVDYKFFLQGDTLANKRKSPHWDSLVWHLNITLLTKFLASVFFWILSYKTIFKQNFLWIHYLSWRKNNFPNFILWALPKVDALGHSGKISYQKFIFWDLVILLFEVYLLTQFSPLLGESKCNWFGPDFK